MKALGVTELPADGENWQSEIKFDGYRALAIRQDGKIGLWSRNQKPLDYPALLPALRALRCRNAVLDGEIVALDARGHSHFQLLQNRDSDRATAIMYYVFDVLLLNGRSLLEEPLEQRRATLAKLVGRSAGLVRISPVFDVAPARLLSEAKRNGLEGVVLKQRGSLYEAGQRSGSWLKVKNLNEQEFVIGGFSPPQRSRVAFGAILVGYYQAGQLHYAGKVGAGFDRKGLRSLHAKFLSLAAESSPFCDLPLVRKSRFGTGMPLSEMARITWVKPELVAQIKFAEWTEDGLLRQPVFLGLRTDKSARDVRREAPAILRSGLTRSRKAAKPE